MDGHTRWTTIFLATYWRHWTNDRADKKLANCNSRCISMFWDCISRVLCANTFLIAFQLLFLRSTSRTAIDMMMPFAHKLLFPTDHTVRTNVNAAQIHAQSGGMSFYRQGVQWCYSLFFLLYHIMMLRLDSATLGVRLWLQQYAPYLYVAYTYDVDPGEEKLLTAVWRLHDSHTTQRQPRSAIR